MKRLCTLFILMISALIWTGCATPGPNYLNLAYTGGPSPAPRARIGISRFSDQRTGMARGELGHRVLNDNSREMFLVQGLDLAGTLTDITQSHLEQKGMTVVPAPGWTPSLAGLKTASVQTDFLVTARINTFHCTARKKGVVTRMTLEADLDFFLALPGEKRLTTKPVRLVLTRTDVHFTMEKLSTFFNDALAEILETGLAFNQN